MYARGNPMKYTDPSGHCADGIVNPIHFMHSPCELGGPEAAAEMEMANAVDNAAVAAQAETAASAEAATPLADAVNASDGAVVYDAPAPSGIEESGTIGENTVTNVSGNLPVEITYRGDARPPDEIFKTGFQPKGANTDLVKYTSYNTPSVYVSTSKSADVATQFAGKGNYVYIVHPQNGIDVNKVLGGSSPFPDEVEIAVPGGIGTQNIVGARQVNSKGMLGALIPNPYYQPSR